MYETDSSEMKSVLKMKAVSSKNKKLLKSLNKKKTIGGKPNNKLPD
jgi:hypothetical protein